jgi:hypothetical protein
MEQTVGILKTASKGRDMDVWEMILKVELLSCPCA